MAELERTLLLVKPDGVQRQLVGRVITRFEERGLKLVGLKLVQTSRELAETHYAAHRERPFFTGLVDFITSAPLAAAELALWFKPEELLSYEREVDRWVLAPAE